MADKHTVTPTQGHAENQAKTADLSAKAKKLFVLEQFREAAEIYKKAFDVSSEPKFLFNIGQCYKRLERPADWDKAIFYFQGFLSYAPSPIEKALVNQTIFKLQVKIKQHRQPAAIQNTKTIAQVDGQRPSPTANKGSETSQRRPWEHIVALSAGMTILSRSFDFSDPRIPAAPANYRSGAVPALLLEAIVYPMAIWTGGHLANIGLEVKYWRVLDLGSQLSGYSDQLSTTMQDQRLGLRYRWNLLNKESSPILTMGLGYGRLGFEIQEAQSVLPNTVYNFLDIAVAHLHFPFLTHHTFSLGGIASFNYLLIFSSGDIEAIDSSGYGQSSTSGVDFGAGIYATFHHVNFRLAGFYKYLSFDFDNQCYKTGTGCKVAGGANDRYLGASCSVGFSY